MYVGTLKKYTIRTIYFALAVVTDANFRMQRGFCWIFKRTDAETMNEAWTIGAGFLLTHMIETKVEAENS